MPHKALRPNGDEGSRARQGGGGDTKRRLNRCTGPKDVLAGTNREKRQCSTEKKLREEGVDVGGGNLELRMEKLDAGVRDDADIKKDGLEGGGWRRGREWRRQRRKSGVVGRRGCGREAGAAATRRTRQTPRVPRTAPNCIRSDQDFPK